MKGLQSLIESVKTLKVKTEKLKEALMTFFKENQNIANLEEPLNMLFN